MSYRERREARTERLREWADKREQAAAATFKADEHYRGDHAFNFQPGHIPERARMIARTDRAFESLDKARGMARRADGIEQQLAGAIYSDDVDAVERLEAKLAELEQKRETMKARNAEYRKAHRAELKTMSPYERGQAVPHASYELQNLGGNIGRTRERLEYLKRAAVVVAAGGRGRGRPMVSRFSSSCAECGETIEKGAAIVYYKLTREAVHAACDEKEG